MNICVMGIGTVGFPTALHINKYHKVYSYDIDPAKVRTANSYFFATTEWAEIPKADVYVVCVNTWFQSSLSDMSVVQDVSKKISERSTPETLVSIESTVTIGTTQKIYKEIFNKQVLLSYCPHRYWGEDPVYHGVKQLRVLGAVEANSLERAKGFYKSIKVPVFVVSSVETAEASKLVENSNRFVQIAFVEELKTICEENNLNFTELREACNTKWNIDLLEARDGIGGHCLQKDIRFLISFARKAKLLKGAVFADEEYKRRIGK